MENEVMRHLIEWSAGTMEVLGVLVIVLMVAFGGLVWITRIMTPGSLNEYKFRIGRALQLSLEFLVAADIIRTVTVRPTLQEVASLGLLVVVRTFLSWSVTVETEGRWPWQAAKAKE